MTVRLKATGGCLLWALLALTAGCSSLDDLENVPFVDAERETQYLPGHASILGPLIDIQWKESVVQWGVRPLFSVRNYRDVPLDQRPQYKVPFFAPPALLSPLARRIPPRTVPGQGRSALQVIALWPIYLHESCGEANRTYCLPFYYNVGDRNEDDGTWNDWGVFILAFGGSSEAHGSYFALFPFGGTLKNQLGRDEIDFIVFPLYLHTRSGDRDSYSVLWPIFNHASGGGRDGWYFWPLIGHMKRFDEPPRWFFLWPLFWYSEPSTEDRPSHSTVLFPFFGSRQSGDNHMTNIMWPFYSHTYNTKTGRSDLLAPWPFYRRGTGPDYDKFSIWPFYNNTTDRQVSRQYYMWPLFRFEQRHTDQNEYRGRSIMLLYRSISNQYMRPDRPTTSDYESILWPLWYYKCDEFGNTYLCSLDFRISPDPQGFDRLYSWIWTFYESESRTYPQDPEKGTWYSTRALFQAFRYDHDNRASFLRVFPIFSSKRDEANQASSFDVLMGMFGYSDRPKQRTYRILFIPWTVKRGEP